MRTIGLSTFVTTLGVTSLSSRLLYQLIGLEISASSRKRYLYHRYFTVLLTQVPWYLFVLMETTSSVSPQRVPSSLGSNETPILDQKLNFQKGFSYFGLVSVIIHKISSFSYGLHCASLVPTILIVGTTSIMQCLDCDWMSSFLLPSTSDSDDHKSTLFITDDTAGNFHLSHTAAICQPRRVLVDEVVDFDKRNSDLVFMRYSYGPLSSYNGVLSQTTMNTFFQYVVRHVHADIHSLAMTSSLSSPSHALVPNLNLLSHMAGIYLFRPLWVTILSKDAHCRILLIISVNVLLPLSQKQGPELICGGTNFGVPKVVKCLIQHISCALNGNTHFQAATNVRKAPTTMLIPNSEVFTADKRFFASSLLRAEVLFLIPTASYVLTLKGGPTLGVHVHILSLELVQHVCQIDVLFGWTKAIVASIFILSHFNDTTALSKGITTTLIAQLSTFLSIWLVQPQHEHEKWSAAIILALLSSYLHVTNHLKKFEDTTRLVQVMCSCKNTLAKGPWEVGLGFYCHDLLLKAATVVAARDEKKLLPAFAHGWLSNLAIVLYCKLSDVAQILCSLLVNTGGTIILSVDFPLLLTSYFGCLTLSLGAKWDKTSLYCLPWSCTVLATRLMIIGRTSDFETAFRKNPVYLDRAQDLLLQCDFDTPPANTKTATHDGESGGTPLDVDLLFWPEQCVMAIPAIQLLTLVHQILQDASVYLQRIMCLHFYLSKFNLRELSVLKSSAGLVSLLR
ncbi:uncharacterized protein LOC126788138 isoform X2 [Argentina anserina]|uniref:uncharacterized protein LOC126788138 isoform X2 n=1 Tax=Argentina anserina TaxID=57926 RepID=UPI00217677C6|nr:uncharacterized protein LOC126788138 isoform X2 [Potentilla anserina]